MSYVDTTITWREDSDGVLIERVVQYDSVGEVVFETAEIMLEEVVQSQYLEDLDAIEDAKTLIHRSELSANTNGPQETVITATVPGSAISSPQHTLVVTSDVRDGRSILGSVLGIREYHIWTPTASNDTLSLLLDVVRKGNFLCLEGQSLLRDAYVLERRTEGYGRYSNVGMMIIPSLGDTLPLWAFADIALARAAVWNWKDMTPMSIDQYHQLKSQNESVQYIFTSKPVSKANEDVKK